MVTKQEAQSSERGRRREQIGVVSSDKMDKTITVTVNRRVTHAKYKKFMSRTSTFYAHDEKNEAKVGDRVLIFECRPLSKSKRWKLAQILERGEAVEG